MKLLEKIISNTKAYFKKNSFEKGVLGLSGGIDSALSLYVAVKALGSKNVTALILPEHGLTKKENIKDAIKLCKKFKVKYFVIPINSFIKELKKVNFNFNDFALAQAKARIRMLLLYFYANSNNALVIGSSNKSELMTGYFTKFGDGAADILPLASLYKTQIINLAKKAGIPKKIINKKPSAELLKNQTDEKELGLKYKEIDAILFAFEKKRKIKLNKEKIDRVKFLLNKSKHKRRMPFIVKI